MSELDSVISNIFLSKKSKFITFLYPYNEFHKNEDSFNAFKNILIDSLRLEHKKAAHFCYAFRFLNQSNQIIEGFSDDGEPKGSAGVPILNVLSGERLVNIVCICIRYFGGVKLGIGGLVRAYGSSALEVVKLAREKNLLREYKKVEIFSLDEKINNFNRILYLLKKYNLSVSEKDFQDESVVVRVAGERNDFVSFLKEYRNN